MRTRKRGVAHHDVRPLPCLTLPLSPFEQLEFFVPEPRRAFGQIVETLLQGRFGPNAVRPGTKYFLQR